MENRFIILLSIPDKEELEERKCQNEDEFSIGELQVHPKIKSKKFPCFRRNRRQQTFSEVLDHLGQLFPKEATK